MKKEATDKKVTAIKERLAVSFDGYCRDSGVAEYSGKSLKKLVAKILNVHNYGIDEEEEDGTLDQDPIAFLTNILDENNGDGCDYIISIIDLNRGKILFSC